MKKTLTSVLTLAAAGVLLLHVPRASAQEDAPPPPPPPAGAPAGAPGEGRGGPRGDWQQRRSEMAKTMLKASDDEWSVIQPLLEKVETKGREVMSVRFGGPGGPGGPGGGRGGRRAEDANGGGNNADGGNRPDRAQRRGGSPEVQALNETLKNDGASVDEIKTKLAAVREQRKKSMAELDKAREDLKKVLNMRQEATLVALGYLD